MEYFRFKTMPLQAANCSEVDYMRSVIVPANIRQTGDWLATMFEAIPSDQQLADLAQSHLDEPEGGSNCPNPNVAERSIAKLSAAVRFAPHSSTQLIRALSLRADTLYAHQQFDAAITDWETLLQIDGAPFASTGAAFRCLIGAKLRLGRKKDAQDDINRYIEHGRKRSARLQQLRGRQSKSARDAAAYAAAKLAFNVTEHNEQIRQLKHRIAHTMERKPPSVSNTSSISPSKPIRPYGGFTPTYAAIRCASVACSLVEKSADNGGPRVLANRFLPRMQPILVERPVARDLLRRGSQCGWCLQAPVCLMPCSECHAVAYCSTRCLASDRGHHQFECFGLKSRVLQLLDGGCLGVRLLVTGLRWLGAQFESRHRPLRTATDLMAFAVSRAAGHQPAANDYCTAFNLPPRLEHFGAADFQQHVMNAALLSQFLLNHTRLVPRTCPTLAAQLGAEFPVFLAALCLRHAAQIRQRVLAVRFTPNAATIGCDQEQDHRRTIGGGQELRAVAERLVAFDTGAVASNIAEYLQAPDPAVGPEKCATKTTAEAATDLRGDVVDDNWFGKYVQLAGGSVDADVDPQRLHRALRLFVQAAYKVADRDTVSAHPMQRMRAICGSLARFRHSCQPNAVVSVLGDADGQVTVVLRTCRDVRPGEELCISYGVHHRLDDRARRDQFLADRAIRCRCAPCAEAEQAGVCPNSIRCANCGFAGHSAGLLCTGCGGPHQSPAPPLFRLIDEAEQLLQRVAAAAASGTISSAATLDAYLRVLVVYVVVWGRQTRGTYMHMLRMAMFLTKINMCQLAFEYFTEIKDTPRSLYPELSAQLFEDSAQHVIALVQLLQHNSKNNAEFYRQNRSTLFDRMHNLAAEHVGNLREIIQVRGLCNTLTAQFDNSCNTLHTLAPPKSGAPTKRIAATKSADSKLSFFEEFYERIKRVTNAQNYCASLDKLVSVGDIFPADGNGFGLDQLLPVAAPKPEEGDIPIYYNTNRDWVWSEEIDEDE